LIALFDYMLAGLGACTVITLQMYAARPRRERAKKRRGTLIFCDAYHTT